MQPAAEALPVRESSHRLTEPESDRVTFVARYFPVAGHRNGELAARTAEAAARQGRFEEMYDKLFITQKEWGERKTGRNPPSAAMRSNSAWA
ncbi:hypothetical protein ABZ214_01405 [Streptomyces iakyrus]|uniref:hypothetical protein n=1 Tax=Streptomyces iakyrus TaxID=68219 RepID=UPI0033A90684